MIEALHTAMMANVSVGGEVSESLSVTNGVKQGCVLAPTLFFVFLSAMLDEAFREMGMTSIYSPDRALIYSTSHTSVTYQVMDALTKKYRGVWPRLVHLSADYARDSATTTRCPCGLKARDTMQSCCPPFYAEPRPGQCTDDR